MAGVAWCIISGLVLFGFLVNNGDSSTAELKSAFASRVELGSEQRGHIKVHTFYDLELGILCYVSSVGGISCLPAEQIRVKPIKKIIHMYKKHNWRMPKIIVLPPPGKTTLSEEIESLY